MGVSGIDVGVWAPDGSALVTPFLLNHSFVQRLGGTEAEAMRIFGKVDVIHDNGIWMPHNHRLAALAKKNATPRIVSTRGMLEPWALNHKRWKKRLAWWAYQRSDLTSACLFHATATREASHLKNLGLRPAIMTIPNGVDLPLEIPPRIPRSSQKIMLFVGRIYPVKGLLLLVEAWAKVRPVGWTMRIVGPDEAGHRAEVESRIQEANLEGVFEFTGELLGAPLLNAYHEANIFVLPSHTENFGMVVGEALALGLPVITTQGTPWSTLESEKCGWWVPVTVDGIADALKDATARSPQELIAMGECGRRVVTERFSWDGVARQFTSCYHWLLGQGNRPACLTEKLGID